MEDFLRKIKLVDTMSTQLSVTTPEFVTAFRKDIEESDIDAFFSGTFEVFSASKKIYKGQIDSRGFYIRKRKKLFNKNRVNINAKGSFVNNLNGLVINTEFNAFNKNRLITQCFFLVCYFAFIAYQVNNGGIFEGFFEDIPIPFIIIFIVMLFIMPYINFRREVGVLKKELEKQYHTTASKIHKTI